MYAEHRLDIYGTAIFLATTRRDWKQLAKQTGIVNKNVPDSAGQVTVRAWEPDKRGLDELHIAVWIDVKNHTDPGELIDTCAHEASHVAGRILEGIGHLVPATDEPHAYLVGWITRWIWEHCTA